MTAGGDLGRVGLLAGLLLLLAACEFVDKAAIPALTGEGTPPRPAALSCTANEIPMSTLGFAAPEISPAAPSDTAAGARLAALRQQLLELQRQIVETNEAIQLHRREAQGAAAQYRARAEAVNAALDRGGSLDKPALRAAWEEAAAALERAAQALARLAEVQRDLGGVAAASTRLQNAVVAPEVMGEGMAEASPEDQAQLERLQAETSRTAAVIDAMRLTLTQDLARAGTYMLQQRTALAALGEALGAEAAAPPLVSSGAPLAALVQGPPAPPPVGGGASLVGRAEPLVLIRFERAPVDYAATLEGAVRAALERRPSAAFDVVAVASAGAEEAQAAARGLEVLGVLTRLGLPAAHLSFSTASRPGLSADEVHVYVR